MALFRSESEEARASAWLGRILLVRPLSFAFLTTAALVIALSLAAFFIAGEYTRKARLAGVLAPKGGVVKVVAQQAGTVHDLRAREGEAIEESLPLMALVDGRARSTLEDLGDSIESRLRDRRRALDMQREHAVAALRSEQAALQHRSAGLERELTQLDAELEIQARRLAVSLRGADRWHRLEGSGFVSAAAADRERDTVLEHESRYEGARRTRLALARELAAVRLEGDTARSRGSAQLAAIDAQAAALDQERIERGARHRLAVLSPVRGTVATVLVETGQMVAPGSTLATILPADAELEAHLFAPSRSIGFIRVGQEVLLRYLAYPHQKFGSHSARVTAIARNPLPPAELGFTPIDGSREPLYRIKVELATQAIAAYGRAEPLQPGMQLEADVQLDRRRLIEWVFEPLLSLAGRT
jgi:membrane fusion protein